MTSGVAQLQRPRDQANGGGSLEACVITHCASPSLSFPTYPVTNHQASDQGDDITGGRGDGPPAREVRCVPGWQCDEGEVYTPHRRAFRLGQRETLAGRGTSAQCLPGPPWLASLTRLMCSKHVL